MLNLKSDTIVGNGGSCQRIIQALLRLGQEDGIGTLKASLCLHCEFYVSLGYRGQPCHKKLERQEKNGRREKCTPTVLDKSYCGSLLSDLFCCWYHPCLGLRGFSWNHHHFCIHCMAIKLFLTSNFGLGGSFQRNERRETPMFQTSCTGFHCPNCSN